MKKLIKPFDGAVRSINKPLIPLASAVLLMLGAQLSAAPFGPPDLLLDSWSWESNNLASDLGYLPLVASNVVALADVAGGYVLLFDTSNTSPVQLVYNCVESDGRTNLCFETGSISWWFNPDWSSTNQAGGEGPGSWARFFEVGKFTTNATADWWAIYLDPTGCSLLFSAQSTNGSQATFLDGPTSLAAGTWNYLVLTYTPTNSVFYLDGEHVTNGAGMTLAPGSAAQAGGFSIGSSITGGLSQAGGLIADVETYNYPLDAVEIAVNYRIKWPGGAPVGQPLLVSAPSTPGTNDGNFDAVMGAGAIGYVTNLSSGCVTSALPWFTNVVVSHVGAGTNLTTRLQFSVVGGVSGINGGLYDVFGATRITGPKLGSSQWWWLGQITNCATWVVSNLVDDAVLLVLGTPQITDSRSGLTDAFKLLVAKMDPSLWDSAALGIPDWWTWVYLHTNHIGPAALALAPVGNGSLRIITPNLLELTLISSDTTTWNFVTNVFTGIVTNYMTNGTIITTNYITNYVAMADPPNGTNFQVMANGAAIGVQQVGFKRDVLYAPFEFTDLRIQNTLYLVLSNSVADNATVVVSNLNGAVWSTNLMFTALKDPLRYSPAIHVNQVGYLPNQPGYSNSLPKTAMIGYFLGSLGEMQVSTNLGFWLLDTATGTQAYPSNFTSGKLTARPDNPSDWPSPGTNTHQPQYQQVLEADFTAFSTPGTYKLVVPGLGASFPFAINNGVAMTLARTYALGLYHQRCGSGASGQQIDDMPFTRFEHPNCHTNKASIPLPESNYTDTWESVMFGEYTQNTYSLNPDNPPQIATPVTNASAVLFAYPTNVTNIDVSGGHHDAGDYSKYTINSAQLIHILTFAADNLGLTNMDNLGIPESTNAKPDILDELSLEAQFLAKMQDADGGFFFLVYPEGEEYESHELPQNGDPQVVWPKQTAATAAAVAALAEVGSSPSFRTYFGTNLADRYLQQAEAGWNFLMNAFSNAEANAGALTNYYHQGKDLCYQLLMPYGDNFTHDDELAWAAASLFAATGSNIYAQMLYKWYPNPADPNGHNGFQVKWIYDGGSVPTSGTNLVVVQYVPNTNVLTSTSNPMYFSIFDSQSSNVITVADTNIPNIANTNVMPKLTDLKGYLNSKFTVYDHSQDTSILDQVSSLVGQCHKTWLNGFVRCDEGYGAAVRDYAFAARSGRLSVTNLNSNYLAQCESEITNRALDVMSWSSNNAYGTSLDPASKGHDTSQYLVGYYFAGDRVFDLAVADRIHADPAHIAAMIENFNYEAGRNPVNTCFITGLGSQRQREIVDQFAQNNPLAVLPPSGIPLGNICDNFYEPGGGWPYEPLSAYYFPPLGTGTNTFGLYDRWAQTYNLHTEFVHPQTARSFVAAAVLANLTSVSTQAWQSAVGTIQFVTGAPALNAPGLAKVVCTNVDLSQAQILWDPSPTAWNGLGQDPTFGSNYVILPTSVGDERTLQAEAVLPDGRRVFATTNFSVYDPANGGTNFLPNSNTVALYHFDTNLVADSGPSNYTLVTTTNVLNGVSLAPNANWMRNPTGYVARFTGVGNQLSATFPRMSFFDGNGNPTWVTIEFEIYPRAYQSPSSGWAYITSLSQDYYSYWSLQYAEGGTPNYPFIESSGGTTNLTLAQWGEYLTPNTWHSLRMTTAGYQYQPADPPQGQTQIFIDGASISTNNTSYFPHSAPSGTNNWDWVLTLGNFNGDIDEVRISNALEP